MTWHFYAVLSALAAGATAVFAKAGLEDVPSNLANTARTLIVLGLAAGITFVTGEHRELGTISRRAWVMLTLSGCMTALSWMAYFKALSMGPATPVTAIDKASLGVTLVLAMLFLGEAFNWKVGVGVAMIVAGALLASR